MSAIKVNAAGDAAATAIGNGDYATAKMHALKALAYLIAIPDGGFREGATMEYDRGSIKDLIAQCDSQLSASAGIQRTKLQYARPSAAL